MGNSSSDRPIENEKENRLVQFLHYRDALIEMLKSADTPLTIGVFGDWGSGKTSLLKLIYEKLAKEGLLRDRKHHKMRPVWFEAWLYTNEAALWRALLLAVLNVFYPCWADGQPKSQQEMSEQEQKLAQKLDDMSKSLYADVSRQEFGRVTVDTEKLLQGAVKGVTHLTLSLVPGIGGMLPKLVEEVQKGLGGNDIGQIFDAIQREHIIYLRRQVASLEQFRQDFRRVVKEEVSAKNEVLLIFIDDLDRCLPEKAIEVLESIKLFLDVPGVVFLIAIDPKVIIRGVQVKYRDFLKVSVEGAELPISGDDYLEKIIQVPFRLLPLERKIVSEFIRQCDPGLFEGCAKVFVTGLEPNPRKVKKALNVFNVIWKIAERMAEPRLEHPELVAKILVIQDRYPRLHEQIVKSPQLLKSLEQKARERFEKDEMDLQSQVDTSSAAPIWESYLDRTLVKMLSQEPYFAPLEQSQLEKYLFFTRAASSTTVTIEPVRPEDIWNDFLSNDLEKIRNRVYEITASGPKDQWIERLQTGLLPGTSLSVSQRISVGTALSLLGDLRNFWELSVPIGDEPDRIYRISKYLITNQQYYEFVQTRGYPKPDHWPGDSPPPELRNHPVTFVSWKNATAFCEWLTEEWRGKGQLESNQAVRLPTIADWQRAAGATTYPWGSEFHSESCNTAEAGIGRTTPVGIYPEGASEYSVLDMAGNVREWVKDGKPNSDSRWVCGGSWADPKERVKSSFIDSFVPDLRNNRTGFRIVVAPALPEVSAS